MTPAQRRVSWDRLLWGVRFTGMKNDPEPMLIGSLWYGPRESQYEGEPARSLTFCTRREAAAWCKAKMSQFVNRTDCCADWRFTPVRVREITREVRK